MENQKSLSEYTPEELKEYYLEQQAEYEYEEMKIAEAEEMEEEYEPEYWRRIRAWILWRWRYRLIYIYYNLETWKQQKYKKLQRLMNGNDLMELSSTSIWS